MRRISCRVACIRVQVEVLSNEEHIARKLRVGEHVCLIYNLELYLEALIQQLFTLIRSDVYAHVVTLVIYVCTHEYTSSEKYYIYLVWAILSLNCCLTPFAKSKERRIWEQEAPRDIPAIYERENVQVFTSLASVLILV